MEEAWRHGGKCLMWNSTSRVDQSGHSRIIPFYGRVELDEWLVLLLQSGMGYGIYVAALLWV